MPCVHNVNKIHLKKMKSTHRDHLKTQTRQPIDERLRPSSQSHTTSFPYAVSSFPSLAISRKPSWHKCIIKIIKIPFWVRVPVLSLKRYVILPNSSGNVLVRTIVLGISASFMMRWAYTVFPISRLTRKLSRIISVYEHKSRKQRTWWEW